MKETLKNHPLFLILSEEVIAQIDSLCAEAKTKKIRSDEEDCYTLCYDIDSSSKRAYIGICKSMFPYFPDFKIFLSAHGYDNLTKEQGRAMIDNLYSELETHYAGKHGIIIGEKGIDITGVHPRLKQI